MSQTVHFTVLMRAVYDDSSDGPEVSVDKIREAIIGDADEDGFPIQVFIDSETDDDLFTSGYFLSVEAAQVATDTEVETFAREHAGKEG
jgi:hypothetical protein